MRRLFAAAVISVAGAAYAAMVGLPALAFAVTLAFAAFAVITCAAANRIVGDVAQTTAVSPAVDRHSLARHNALWFAVVFLWGGAVIALGYGLTPLYWQHWWQYALAMALLASISFGVARRLSRPAPSQRMLAALTKVTSIQGAAAIVPACLGLYLGQSVRATVSEDLFRTLLFIWLGLTGVFIVARSLAS
ncbi:MAG: hypothetical protein AAFR23_06520 [Pseudomonadota bacterium]